MGVTRVLYTDFSHGTARLSVYTCVKADTVRLTEVPRSTYFVVLVTAKNLGTGAEAAPFTLSEFAVPCCAEKKRQNVSRTLQCW